MSLKPSVLRFKFKDFESLSSEPDTSVRSEKVTDCHGNIWRLKLYPGGNHSDPLDNEDNYISLFLSNSAERDQKARIALILRGAVGKTCRYKSIGVDTYGGKGKGYGCRYFMKRSDILDTEKKILAKGALVIDVEIQIIGDRNEFQPSNPFAQNMLMLLENGICADINFQVRDILIHAHKLILQVNAPFLFSLCDGSDLETHVLIGDTTPVVFRLVLRYIYGGNAPTEAEVKEMGMDIIHAADRYGVAGLKLAVETTLVELRVVHVDNAASWLLFADAKTCPLLKEYAISYFAARAKDMLAHESFKKLKKSPALMEECMIAMAKDLNNDCVDDTENISVDRLRKQLDEKGLDVDGTKATLVSRLESSNKRQRTE